MSTLITLDDVSVTRRRSESFVHALKNVSLQVTDGDWIGLIGPNGSGKSTLARLIAGLGQVSGGQITRHSLEISQVRMVTQNPDAQIVGQTVYEDLAFGMENACVPPSEMPGRVQNVLSQLGFHVPLDTPVERLSGGQKQLLCIAGALVTSPRCIVFDEPTAMLDPLSRQRILSTAAQLHQRGLTIIWVTQWSEELIYASRVLALNDGEIIFSGSPRTFLYEDCAALGYPPPYVVQVVQELARMGVVLKSQPLRVDGLHECMSHIRKTSLSATGPSAGRIGPESASRASEHECLQEGQL